MTVPGVRHRDPDGQAAGVIGALGQAAYVLLVAGVAAVGFATASTATILVAALLSLPWSVPATVGYYVAYGLLAQIPGANPASSSGSGSCAAAGTCRETTIGDPAPWFAFTGDALGVLAFAVAAGTNVLLLRTLTGRRRRRRASVDDDFAGTPPGW